ncbi:MAG: pyruvate, phosphate dikinase [Planctomycetes bacterium]|nr:pyruvate, phosphate dikinase [Planctomycetota bacterium]
MAASTRWIYSFGKGRAEGKGNQKALLGGKGAGLAQMTSIGLPVPAGFTITTEACAHYYQSSRRWPAGLQQQLRTYVARMEKVCRKKLGGAKDPLLVSVRSGASVSMPGMMETILNLGLNDTSVEGLARASGNRRFAWDAYRRLIMMYGATAQGIDRGLFDRAFDDLKEQHTRPRLSRSTDQKILDNDVNAEELAILVNQFKQIYQRETGSPFPQDPHEQLIGAISAVFGSWMAEKAQTYRRVEKITGLPGTAVNICQMVFGNMGDDSGTGVCFTRDPSTGENVYYGDLLINAQGEDVVAGVRTPVKLSELQRSHPPMYDHLVAVRAILELHYKDMQDLEFTFERGELYMLQCRSGKRSPTATFKIAVDQATKPLMSKREAEKLVKKKLLPRKYVAGVTRPIITRHEAIQRIRAEDIERLFFPVIDPQVGADTLAARRMGAGINAVPGAACGQVAFTAAKAEEQAEAGQKVILVREETSPEDVGGMHAAVGILTATGGKTSHAAVVARGWGKCCVVGCDALSIDLSAGRMSVNGRTLREGDFLTLDGSSGDIYEGSIKLVRPESPPEYDTIMKWSDQVRRLGVRTNADTPADAAKAIEHGAEGIGLCRTEHMFFDPSEPQRLQAMRQMILASDLAGRCRALDRLLPFQRKDFEGIFEVMDGKPVTIRLLDPPLHEFLPHDAATQKKLADDLNRDGAVSESVTAEQIRQRVEQLHEFNPMLGHRGCRLCITYPEILEMQVRAIMEAAVNCTRRKTRVRPEIMIPLSIDDVELRILVERTRSVANAILKEAGMKIRYWVGTMIETPRAALLGDRLAGVAEFFSFGTNDLTQMTMGLSRDDAGRFLPEYVDQDKSAIFASDPFQTLDRDGVGELVRIGIAKGRSVNPELKIGICGEHGGDPESIDFCHQVGMDYVSCSPYRVPIARLAAAQAALRADRPVTKTGTRRAKNTTAKPTRRLSPASIARKKTAIRKTKK